MAEIFLNPGRLSATIDGLVAEGVDFTGIDPNIELVSWFNGSGFITYARDVSDTYTPPPTTFSDLSAFQAYVDTATDIIYAYENPVTYYTLTETSGFPVGSPIIVKSVGHPQPADTTELVPPTPAEGQTLQWDGSAWVLASFDISLSLADAKTSLIQTVTISGAAAVNSEISLYSTVQQIQAADVTLLNTKTYPSSTMGDYQTYIDGLISSATSTINAATTVQDLYTFNPAELIYFPPSL